MAAVSGGQPLPIKFEAINRSKVPVQLLEVRIPVTGETLRWISRCPTTSLSRKNSRPLCRKRSLRRSPIGCESGQRSTFVVDGQTLIGLAQNPAPFPIEVALRVGDHDLRYRVETKFRTVDPTIGEVRQDLVIAPPIFVNLSNPAFVFERRQTKDRPGARRGRDRCGPRSTSARSPEGMADRAGVVADRSKRCEGRNVFDLHH